MQMGARAANEEVAPGQRLCPPARDGVSDLSLETISGVLRGARMGNWIRRRWICVWSAPEFRPKSR